MSDVAGGAPADRIEPVNLLTATRLARVPVQRLGFRLSKAPGWLARAFDEEALSAQLKTFNFLHTARWVYLGRFPRVPGVRRERLFGPRWVVYVANYDGPWEPYFGTFMEAMGEGVYDVWGQSVGYPGFPAPGTANRLRAWLASRLPASDHWYAAYPWATANDVRAAVRVRREATSTALDLLHSGAAPGDDVTDRFDALVGRLRHCLDPITPPPRPPGWPADPATPRRSPSPDGALRGLVAALPIAPGREDDLRAAIAGLGPGGTASPLRAVPGLHFARLAVLDRTRIGWHPEPADRLETRCSYLLFAADHDAAPPWDAADRAMLEAVWDALPAEMAAVWSHCAGFPSSPDAASFASYVLRGRAPVLREFIDCPDQPLESVLAALAGHAPFVDLVAARQASGRVDAGALLAFLG